VANQSSELLLTSASGYILRRHCGALFDAPAATQERTPAPRMLLLLLREE
jgi:hypothetical protein